LLLQAGNFVREEILSAFIRLVAHTPELQAYTASKLYTTLKADLSQESLTLAATWVLGEYADVLLETGLVDEEAPRPVRDIEITELILSVLDSPYASYLTRQFVLASITKISARPSTGATAQEKIAGVLASYTSNAELETQQRAVEFASLYALGEDLRSGVLERMPPPEIKATIMGVGEPHYVRLGWFMKV
jgi:AP-1 complex subunit gamma-1